MIRTIVLLLLCCSFLPAVAQAQYGTAVLPFEGRQAARIQRVVRRAIREQVDLKSRAELQAAVNASRGDLETSDGLAAVAREGGISLFVRGTVGGSRRAPTLSLVVLDGNGAELSTTETGPIRGRAGTRAVNEAARTVVAAAAAELDARAQAAREAEAARDQAEIERMRGVGPGNQDGVGELEPEEELENQGTPLPLVEAVIGWGGRYRDWNVELETPGASRVYSATFSEIYARLRSHPLRDEGGLLAGLYGEFEFALAIGLDSVDEATDTNIPSNAVRLEGGVGWLLGPVGPVRLGPYLAFGYDSFSFDPNTILPSASYTYLRPTFVLLADLINPFLQLRVDAALRMVLSSGDLSPFFGTDTTVLGFDAGLELGGALDFGLVYGGRFGIQSYGQSFEGEGLPPTNSAVDGTDLRLIFTAFAGYRL